MDLAIEYEGPTQNRAVQPRSAIVLAATHCIDMTTMPSQMGAQSLQP